MQAYVTPWAGIKGEIYGNISWSSAEKPEKVIIESSEDLEFKEFYNIKTKKRKYSNIVSFSSSEILEQGFISFVSEVKKEAKPDSEGFIQFTLLPQNKKERLLFKIIGPQILLDWKVKRTRPRVFNIQIDVNVKGPMRAKKINLVLDSSFKPEQIKYEKAFFTFFDNNELFENAKLKLEKIVELIKDVRKGTYDFTIHAEYEDEYGNKYVSKALEKKLKIKEERSTINFVSFAKGFDQTALTEMPIILKPGPG